MRQLGSCSRSQSPSGSHLERERKRNCLPFSYGQWLLSLKHLVPGGAHLTLKSGQSTDLEPGKPGWMAKGSKRSMLDLSNSFNDLHGTLCHRLIRTSFPDTSSFL